MLYIKGGRVVNPVTGYDGPADVAILGNTIVGAGPDLDIEEVKARCDVSQADIQEIDASGFVVAPGLVLMFIFVIRDLHIKRI